MVNASLNWASIVGIVLAVCGAGLYFMRSFKPALARDYDVFFAAIGLLCGGILFFQGWRLDPILQFGQFLLAGTTVFFAYESVRLRGVATDQARRSSYFDEPESIQSPRGGLQGRRWEDSYDRFDDGQAINRRFSGGDDLEEDSSYNNSDPYQPRRVSRAAIPEEAVSRRSERTRTQRDDFEDGSLRTRRINRSRNDLQSEKRSDFGARRASRQDVRRGSRPLPNDQNSIGRGKFSRDRNSSSSINDMKLPERRVRGSEGSSTGKSIEDAAFSTRRSSNGLSDKDFSRRNPRSTRSDRSSSSGTRYSRSSSKGKINRDNNSRFDD